MPQDSDVDAVPDDAFSDHVPCPRGEVGQHGGVRVACAVAMDPLELPSSRRFVGGASWGGKPDAEEARSLTQGPCVSAPHMGDVPDHREACHIAQGEGGPVRVHCSSWRVVRIQNLIQGDCVVDRWEHVFREEGGPERP